MIVIEFIGTCRDHDIQQKVQMRGKDTPRQLENGYTELDRKMRRNGCDDYSKTHSVTKQPNEARLPYLYMPHYPKPERTFDSEYTSKWPEDEE